MKQSIDCMILPESTKAMIADLPGKIRVHVTHKDKRLELTHSVSWRAQSPKRDGGVVVSPKKSFQTVLGFGAAFTDAACYLLDRLPPLTQKQFLNELFNPGLIGLNCCRVCVGASDYATKAYSYDDDGPDPTLEHFSIDHDKAYILPLIKHARIICPELFLLASPWSPPGWMKVGGSMCGGMIRRKHFATYAGYLLKFLRSYSEEGVSVDALTVQNEVDTDQEGRMPACFWGQGNETRFIVEHLGPRLRKLGLDTKIWILDHNYDLWGRVLGQLDDSSLHQLVDGVAWHGYFGHPSAMTVVHNSHPDKHMYWTEGGPEDLHDPNLETNWAHWGARFTAIMRNWSECIIAWNLALDEKGKPNIGPFSCAGLVTIDSQSQEIRRSGQYWALAHFSSAVRRGAHRIQSSGSVRSVSHVAFRNPDQSCAMVLTNPGRSRTLKVCLESSHEAEIELPADSLVTLVWNSSGNEAASL